MIEFLTEDAGFTEEELIAIGTAEIQGLEIAWGNNYSNQDQEDQD